LAPLKVGAPTVATCKQTKRPSVAPVFEETPRAWASQQSFHRDYIPPRKDTVPQFRVPTDGKYPSFMLDIPPGVIIEGDMLGNIVALKFVDHEIMDEQKFLEMERENCLCAKRIPGTGSIMLEP
jgi:hypothetical protein